MRQTISKIILILLIAGTAFGCVTHTSVVFESNAEGAELYIDGQPFGTVPTEVKMSNAIWEDPDIRLEKEGYRTTSTLVDKQVQPVNLAVGLTIWQWSLLWCYGPQPYQYIKMYPES